MSSPLDGVPVEKCAGGEGEKLLAMEDALRAPAWWQDEALGVAVPS
jgi:hypothetical protein